MDHDTFRVFSGGAGMRPGSLLRGDLGNRSCKLTNLQTYKITNLQTLKLTNLQTHKHSLDTFTNLQTFQLSSGTFTNFHFTKLQTYKVGKRDSSAVEDLVFLQIGKISLICCCSSGRSFCSGEQNLAGRNGCRLER